MRSRFAPACPERPLALDDDQIHRLVACEMEPPEATAALLDDYVHDSLAGFYMWRFTELTAPGIRTNGYFRHRGVFELGQSAAPVCESEATTPARG